MRGGGQGRKGRRIPSNRFFLTLSQTLKFPSWGIDGEETRCIKYKHRGLFASHGGWEMALTQHGKHLGLSIFLVSGWKKNKQKFIMNSAFCVIRFAHLIMKLKTSSHFLFFPEPLTCCRRFCMTIINKWIHFIAVQNKKQTEEVDCVLTQNYGSSVNIWFSVKLHHLSPDCSAIQLKAFQYFRIYTIVI